MTERIPDQIVNKHGKTFAITAQTGVIAFPGIHDERVSGMQRAPFIHHLADKLRNRDLARRIGHSILAGDHQEGLNQPLHPSPGSLNA
jgi:hypothetical protein